MRVRVKLFASFAQLAGWREKDLEVHDGAVARDLLAQLGRSALIALPPGTRPLVAVNRRHVPMSEPLADGDEVAVFPPVSGGSPQAKSEDGAPPVFVTAEPLDARTLAEAVRAPELGAVVTFEGTVRNENEGAAVVAMEYECYDAMAAGVLEDIRREALARWPASRIALAHRTGRLVVGEVSVVIACASRHRRDAFAACAFAMDRVKESLPAWKAEERLPGGRVWLA